MEERCLYASLMRWLKKSGWILLSAFSFLLLGLAFIPVLFPVVLILGLVLCTAMIIRLWKGQRSGMTISAIDPTGPIRRPESRILRRTIFAMGTVLLLYALLWLHSQFFYIGPLKKDQEPFRQDAVEQFREGAASESKP